jgi:hypothetical protein
MSKYLLGNYKVVPIRFQVGYLLLKIHVVQRPIIRLVNELLAQGENIDSVIVDCFRFRARFDVHAGNAVVGTEVNQVMFFPVFTNCSIFHLAQSTASSV